MIRLSDCCEMMQKLGNGCCGSSSGHSMRKFNVPATEEAELVAIINSTRGDIVVEPAASPDIGRE